MTDMCWDDVTPWVSGPTATRVSSLVHSDKHVFPSQPVLPRKGTGTPRKLRCWHLSVLTPDALPTVCEGLVCGQDAPLELSFTQCLLRWQLSLCLRSTICGDSPYVLYIFLLHFTSNFRSHSEIGPVSPHVNIFPPSVNIYTGINSFLTSVYFPFQSRPCTWHLLHFS